MRIHLFLLLFVIAVFIWSMIKPLGGSLSWVLEVGPAFLLLIIAIATYNKLRLTTLSYFIIAILSILMMIGGHYTYGKVPIFNWIKDTFELKRNYYDRFGHFIKGLFAIVIREILLRKIPLIKGFWLVTMVLTTSLAISSLYEIIEWIVSIIIKGETAKNFLGIQGSNWDTQWDMLLAFIGSILALLILSKLHNRLLKKELIK
ncbi:MAG: DUF2238 domain-containing protein [Bacillota bacterium]|nr:DUF2238 domain-containing protein [Bacillota bacterium]